ncbi:sulfurtransferase complex subunit TusB [Necropsobacter rosorum]|uniref:sulfurtransferase complex subunit TusB n=1 Tax=Necropsobacter rosorum TaxID=908285 RepID=UPI000509DFFB
MLYTFSQADYNPAHLQRWLAQTTAQDAVLLWQDGVLLGVKYPDLFARSAAACYALENDIAARGIRPLMPPQVRSVSMDFLVALSERYFPQVAL